MTPALQMTRSNGLPSSTSALAQTHAVQRREVELDQLKPAAVDGGSAHACGRRFGLGQIARGAHHIGAVSYERAGRLHAEAG
jgi:hypothetical protein